MCYVYSNDRMLSVYLHKVHVGTLPKICSSVTIQTAALVHRTSYDTDSPLLTRRTYLSDHGPCAAVPVYKRPVFQQSSPKLDLILNINVLESSPCASPFPHLLHKPLRVVSSNTRDFYSFKVLATSSLLVQVILSRPVEALTTRDNRQDTTCKKTTCNM